MSRLTNRYAELLVEDAGTFSYTFEDVGDFKFDNLQEGNADAVPVYERGVFVGYVFGPEKPATGSFTCNVPRSAFTDPSNASLFDVLTRSGAAGSTTTTNPGGWGPMTYTGKYTVNAGGVGGRVQLNNFRISGSYDESGDVVKVAINFQAHGRVITG